MDGELKRERSERLPCWLPLVSWPPYGAPPSLSSCMGVLEPPPPPPLAVGDDCELLTVGGEFGPDSGLLPESEIVAVDG